MQSAMRYCGTKEENPKIIDLINFPMIREPIYEASNNQPDAQCIYMCVCRLAIYKLCTRFNKRHLLQIEKNGFFLFFFSFL